MTSWKIRIDSGGTFTDCWALPPGHSSPRLLKVLSSGRLRVAMRPHDDPDKVIVDIPQSWNTPDGFFAGFQSNLGEVVDSVGNTIIFQVSLTESLDSLELYSGEEAPVIGIRLLTGTPIGGGFPKIDLRLATTRATNALLEGKGAAIDFFVTEGFGDLLKIRDQRRPELFALEHHKVKPLYDAVIEVRGRLDAEGNELEPLRKPEIVTGHSNRYAAVALLHSYRNPAHEIALREHLLVNGYEHVSLSSELAPMIKLLPRAETAVVDAYLTPVMQSFINHVQERLGDGTRMLAMTSAGGLEPASQFRPKDSLLSGPAGGVVGATASARAVGFGNVLTFDMGGTSTDVARIDNADFHYRFNHKVGAATLFSPALKIETVAAGGGSICQFDAATGQLRVGPESAGASPGPACYGRGGPLTITDVNLLLGRIDPDNFGIPLSSENLAAARHAALGLQGAASRQVDELDFDFLKGLLELATEQMADAIRTISVREGADPSDYAILAFGGAGGLHACAIADKLGIDTVVIPSEAGVLSAYGLHYARVERIAEQQLLTPLSEVPPLLVNDLENEALDHLSREANVPTASLNIRRRLAELRLEGQDSALSVDFEEISDLEGEFRDRFEAIFGYRPPHDRRIEAVSIRVIASSQDTDVPQKNAKTADAKTAVTNANRMGATFLNRSELPAGVSISGPIVIQDPFSTTWLPVGWLSTVEENGTLILKRSLSPDATPSTVNDDLVINRELFRHRFTQIVEEMGALLERSAISTNVKERLDFSCALLDANGELVVNAPHIPVHLGALGLCVRRAVKELPLGPGDMIITNHPGFGGSHLPDVTLIASAYDGSGQLIGYLANRAHHAEIGGITPGSMPPGAQTLAEEGVVIPPTYLFKAGKAQYGEVEKLLTNPPFPTRKLADNIADLHAQAASNQRGVAALQELATSFGSNVVREHLDGLTSTLAIALREALIREGFPAEESAFQSLDDGTQIQITATHDLETHRLKLDFTGTSLNHPGNLNATPAIVRSAVLYTLRLWSQTDLPLNEGLLRDVEIVLPTCFLNPDFPDNPRNCPAVVGGNVETSQRLVDTLIQLFGFQAGSQGTMNNFIFGDETFGYYETICGGAGAGAGYHGADALHTHMTNTSITDPEILEQRYPVRLRNFSIRGRGEYNERCGLFRGGSGVIREVEFLKSLTVSLLTQHRSFGAFGMNGGHEGEPGCQTITRANGDVEKLPAIGSIEVDEGDCLKIETPSGGDYLVSGKKR